MVALLTSRVGVEAHHKVRPIRTISALSPSPSHSFLISSETWSSVSGSLMYSSPSVTKDLHTEHTHRSWTGTLACTELDSERSARASAPAMTAAHAPRKNPRLGSMVCGVRGEECPPVANLKGHELTRLGKIFQVIRFLQHGTIFRRAMSESSSDDDFAAELEAGMTAVTPSPAPAPRPTVVVTAPATRRGGVDALLRGVGQKAEVRAFTSDAGPSTATAPRRAVKRRRVPMIPSGVTGTSSGGIPSSQQPSSTTQCPPHPGFLHDICVRCGLRREKQVSNASLDEINKNQTSMRYIHHGLELSKVTLDQAKLEEKQRVVKSGKLMLVLDLDHTLLNSARFGELTQEHHDLLNRVIAARRVADLGGSEEEIARAARDAVGGGGVEIDASAATQTDTDTEIKAGEVAELKPSMTDTDTPSYPGCSPPLHHTHCLRHLVLFTKLRPLVHEFLHAASKLCQLYIYTMGDNRYAAEMASLLDPTGVLFSGRIISNQESTNSRVKDLDIVLGGCESVIIVDDTERVWPNNLKNLIRIDRYHFFTQSAAGFRQPGASVMEKEWTDEGKNGDRAQLRDVVTVIANAHRLFFAGTEAAGLADSALKGFADGVTTTTDSKNVPVALSDDSLALVRHRDVRQLLLGGESNDTPQPFARPLQDVSIAFSRITARGEPKPERHPLWLLASSAGAATSNEICETSENEDKKTTHVIVRGDVNDDASTLTTEKTKWACVNNACAVTGEWLWMCSQRWARVDETAFSVLKGDDSENKEKSFAAFEADADDEVSA